MRNCKPMSSSYLLLYKINAYFFGGGGLPFGIPYTKNKFVYLETWSVLE